MGILNPSLILSAYTYAYNMIFNNTVILFTEPKTSESGNGISEQKDATETYEHGCQAETGELFSCMSYLSLPVWLQYQGSVHTKVSRFVSISVTH